MDPYFLIHLASTSFMCGLIWFVQLVHYPSFVFVNKDDFTKFEKFHCDRTSLVVMPLMLAEVLSGFYLYINGNPSELFIISLVLLGLIWLSTFIIQTRQHEILISGYSIDTIKDLVKYNWIRTILWTIRLILITFPLIKS
jgi:hypothetical protein